MLETWNLFGPYNTELSGYKLRNVFEHIYEKKASQNMLSGLNSEIFDKEHLFEYDISFSWQA